MVHQRQNCFVRRLSNEEDRHCMYNVILRGIRATVDAIEKQ